MRDWKSRLRYGVYVAEILGLGLVALVEIPGAILHNWDPKKVDLPRAWRALTRRSSCRPK